MNGRPESLFPLFVPMIELAGIGPRTAKQLSTLSIAKPRDMLFTLPRSVLIRRSVTSVSGLEPQALVTVEIKVQSHVPNQGRGTPYRVWANDGRTRLQLVFFNVSGNWIEEKLPTGSRRVISGKLDSFGGVPQFVHPDYILSPDAADQIPKSEPVYPLASGLTQKFLVNAVRMAQDRAPDFPEWISPDRQKAHGWPAWKSAVAEAHAPESPNDVDPASPARERLAFDELFAHQMTLALARRRIRRSRGRSNSGNGKLSGRVRSALPFTMTRGQDRAFAEISRDMAGDERMNRLLQGDVGSGKTLVAFLAVLNAVESDGQGVMMAPTEILVRQHFESLKPLARAARIDMETLTGRDRGRERAKKLEGLRSGNIDVLLGTHAVFQDDVAFADLRIVVIDEQHRFGVRQRMSLTAKGKGIDVLVMTATPIPRSLALACYGDMDVSVLDEKPPGRQPVKTALASEGRMAHVISRLQAAIKKGHQAYWVCPLVEDSEKSPLTAAEDRSRMLQAILGEDRVGLVHGQMPADDRDRVFDAFADGSIRVLVATTVVEVGVDVPGATIMIVEHAQNFGLAQLHQLRGRVGRGRDESTCLLLYREPLGEMARRRLKIMQQTDDGFRIADEDLAMRGAGDLLGVQQSGLPRFRIADLESQPALLREAHEDAQAFVRDDPDLTSARGKAVRTLLYLMEQDRSVRLISVG